MPGFNLLSRLHRKREITSTDNVSPSTEPRITPEPRASQAEYAIMSPQFERRIHPDLNALAEELSSEKPSVNNSNEISRPTQPENNIPLVSLTPWRNRRNSSSATPITTQIMNNDPRNQETLESIPDPISSDTSLTEDNEHRSNTSSTSSSNRRPESRANRMIHRLTGLGARASPTPNPPSAWNTFGRRKSRMHNSIPHISDFGASPDVSLSSSQRSRASSQPAETSADLSGSFSGQSLQSVSPPHSRSQSYTPSEPRYSPPSTGFTFGSIGPAFGQSLTPPVPLNLALRFNLGGGMRKATEGQNEVKGSMNLESLSPRPSASMPSLSRHRHLESLSNDGYDNPTSTGPSRPRAQDIFPASSSSDELHRGHRRHRKDTNRSTGSSNNSKPRRYTRREALPPTSAGFAPVPDSFLCETRVNNADISKALGEPFHLQHMLGPTAVDENSNLSTSTNNSSYSRNEFLNSSMVTPPRGSSSGGSGNEPATAKSKSKGKQRPTSDPSRTPSPLRNVTQPSTLAKFPVPPLPTSRPATPLRSAMASSSKLELSSSPAIPLATSNSASSLGKGKRKADEVDGGGDDVAPSEITITPERKKQQRAVHRATFAIEPRTHRTSTSTSSYTASHYARRKRVRLSSGTSFATTQNISETGSRVAPSRDGSYRHPPPPTNGSVRPSSRDSRTPTQSSFRGGSVSSHQHSVRFTGQPQRVRGPSSTVGSSRRNSVSQTSIPLSALVSPHAPSISIHRATPYHMRDPRKPSPVHPTSWSLTFPSPGPEERSYFSGCVNGMTCCWGVGGLLERLFQRDGKQLGGDPEKQVVEQEESGGKLQVVDWIEGGGSPIHAWLFFLGFIFFPSWWIAGLFVGIPKTRRLGAGTPGEKSVVLDDPQVEHDAKTWRTRCRVMSVLSLFTYVPFIILVIIFVPRS